jgi:hypothetical protein
VGDHEGADGASEGSAPARNESEGIHEKIGSEQKV